MLALAGEGKKRGSRWAPEQLAVLPSPSKTRPPEGKEAPGGG